MFLYVQRAKYFGVEFNQRFTKNPHIQKNNQQDLRPVQQVYGFSPEVTLWLYTLVIKSMVIFGALIW